MRNGSTMDSTSCVRRLRKPKNELLWKFCLILSLCLLYMRIGRLIEIFLSRTCSKVWLGSFSLMSPAQNGLTKKMLCFHCIAALH